MIQVIYVDGTKARFSNDIIDTGKEIDTYFHIDNNDIEKIPLKENNKWIMKDKPKKIYTNEEKIKKLRSIRDDLLVSTIWIQQRHYGETEGKNRGLTQKDSTITEADFNNWLLYWGELRDLPISADIENTEYENIHTLFPQMPEIIL